MTFHFGKDPETELTREQVLQQCRMYIAAVRIAETFGCDAIGIQYQQGLKDLHARLRPRRGDAEQRRPSACHEARTESRSATARPSSHFNEVDECAGLDALFTNRVHRALGQPVEKTLHDIRWGDADRSGSTKDYVWVFEISGAAPPAHFIGGWAGADSLRQPPMYFRLGGGTMRGVAKPGEIVWSRIFVEAGRLKMDLGRARVAELPREETERRWRDTTPQWPIMHARAARRDARPDDGPAQGQPHPGRLCQFARGGGPRAGDESGARRRTRPRSLSLRHESGRSAARWIEIGRNGMPREKLAPAVECDQDWRLKTVLGAVRDLRCFLPRGRFSKNSLTPCMPDDFYP